MITVTNGVKYFGDKAVLDGVNIHIKPGEVYALVGESGSGKTTCGKIIMGELQLDQGEVKFHDQNIAHMSKSQRKQFYRKAQMIEQDAVGALDPSWRIQNILKEGIRENMNLSKAEQNEMVLQYLSLVGLDKSVMNKHAFQLSGGQCQRINIARALMLQPEFIVCDEIISALDVSTQAQIVNLIIDSKKNYNGSYLFICHNLLIVKYIADTVSILYEGKIVEHGDKESIFREPLHPYTCKLLAIENHKEPKIAPIKKDLCLGIKHCRYAQLCTNATKRCYEEEPESYCVDKGHFVSCFLYEL